MPLTVENLCGYIIRSRLLAADAVNRLREQWAKASPQPKNLREFSRWLVRQGQLTEYQAILLSHGHTQGFFLDQYKILERIGKGRFAGVYKAVHALGQTVAIKVLPPSKAKEPQTLARFQREAQMATQLSHPSVVQTFQIGESGGLHYIVMEYLEGETLDNLLKERGPLPPKEAVRLAFLTALGLQHIHEKGLVHRDIKPGNLMLTPKPKEGENTLRAMVKILDIGLGRELFRGRGRAYRADLTTEGQILGTADYMAPEQARDSKRADIRSDLYGLGCSLYHCLTGQPPFPDDNPVRQIVRHATEQPRPFREFNLAIPDGLSRIVMRLMAKEPGQRYQTPAEAAEALKAFLAGVPEPVRTETAQMRTYLEWLKKPGGSGSAASPRSPPAAVPANANPPPRLAAKPLPSAARVLRDERRRSRLRRPPPPPTAPEALPPPEKIDVELVLEAPSRVCGVPRDWFFILVGIIGGATFVGMIWLIATLAK